MEVFVGVSVAVSVGVSVNVYWYVTGCDWQKACETGKRIIKKKYLLNMG